MKVIKKSLFIISTLLFVTSCATNKVNTDEVFIEESVEEADEIEVVELPPEPTPEELFIESLNDVNLEFVQMPKTANFGKAFSCSYKVLVTNSKKEPLANFPVTFFYPSAKNDFVEFSNVSILTNEEGIAEYTQEPLNFGIKDFVVAYPTPSFEDPIVVDACVEKSIQAQIKVRSNIMTKGAILFVWDFNEKNKPVNNSYEILSELRSYGIVMAGNAPVNESSYIGQSVEKLYKENYEIVEDSYGYLIIGTVKFSEPVSEVDGQYKCSLIAEIKTVNMKTGKIQLEKTYTHEAFGSNWTKSTSKCKEELATIVCEEIIYGL